MKHVADKTRARELEAGAADLGVQLSQEQMELMLSYLDWLTETNAQVNLTSVAPTDAVRLHLLDSLAAFPELESAPDGLAMDLGTGGGLPGIPLAIASSRGFVLLDSVGKKSRALMEFASHLSGVECVAARSEEYALEHPQSVCCVVARAVAPLPSLVELASPLLRRDGRLVCLKGRLDSTEREAGRAAATQCGMTEVGARSFRLPGGTEERCVVSYRKSHEPSRQLPRRPGMAQKRPLA